MRVRELGLRGFRNLADTEVALEVGLICVSGPNGAGKTNLLEAVYFALAGRSCRTPRDRETIGFGADFARCETAVVNGDGEHAFLTTVTRSGDRRHLVDGSPSSPGAPEPRPALGVFMPDRLVLLKGPPAARRAHLDRYVAARWPSRAGVRHSYGRALAQRNALLGRLRAAGTAAGDGALETWDAQLAAAAAELVRLRSEAVAELGEPFARAAGELGLPGETGLEYRPRTDEADPEAIRAGLAARHRGDIERGHTGWGPHLDEVRIEVGGREARRFASQGQQRLAMLALLFAERESLLRATGQMPLLLLDDVMSELDPGRRRLLVDRLAAPGEWQALITATEREQLPAGAECDPISIEAGRVSREAGP